MARRISAWIVGTEEYHVGIGEAQSHLERRRLASMPGVATTEAPEISEASICGEDKERIESFNTSMHGRSMHVSVRTAV